MLFYLIVQGNLILINIRYFFCFGHVAESFARFFINSSTASTIFTIWSIYNLLSVNAIEYSLMLSRQIAGIELARWFTRRRLE